MAAKRQKRKNKEEITLRDFRQWLSGVEDMQGTDWIPDSKQWNIIRDKINTITDDVAGNEQDVVIPSGPVPRPPFIPPNGAPNSFDLTPQLQPSGVPPAPLSQKANSTMASSDQPGIPTTTPDIDTTSGTYNSGFA